VECFHTLDFDLVVLCQSIPLKDKERLTSWIRASGSRIPVVSVSEKPAQDDSFAGVTAGSNPDALLRGIKKALTNAAIPAARTATSRAQQEAAAAAARKSPGLRGSYGGQRRAAQEYFAS